jgi:selenocysteine lyase/cysteine desulfurase
MGSEMELGALGKRMEKNGKKLFMIMVSLSLKKSISYKPHIRGVFVSRRGDSIRFSPHLYNSMSDIDKTLAEIDNFIAKI